MILDRLLGLTKLPGSPSAAASSSTPSSAFPPLSLFSGVASHLSGNLSVSCFVRTGCTCSGSCQRPCKCMYGTAYSCVCGVRSVCDLPSGQGIYHLQS